MTPVDERDAPRTDPNPGAAATDSAEHAENASRTGAEPEPVLSEVRPAVAGKSGEASDTLLSVPQVTKEDLAFDERLSGVERKLEDLLLRVENLERKPAVAREGGLKLRWFWLLFLAALAAAWQILSLK